MKAWLYKYLEGNGYKTDLFWLALFLLMILVKNIILGYPFPKW